MAHPHAHEARSQQAARLHRVVGRSSGGSVTKKEVAAMIHKHEGHDHSGESRTKFARGGCATGGKAAHRGDKKPRGNTHINIMLGHPDGAGAPPPPQARPVPVPVPVRAPAVSPAAGAAPMGMGAGPRPPMGGPMGPMKRGGKAKHARGGAVKLTAGAGGGIGRMEKAKAVKRK